MARKTSSSGLTKNIPAVSADTTKDQQIDGVLSGVAWDAGGFLPNGTLSFSFPDSGADYGKSYGTGEHRKNFGSFTGEEQLAFYNVLANFGSVTTANAAVSGIGYISAVTPLNFVEFGEGSGDDTDKDALLRFGKTDMNSAEAWAYYPSASPTGGDAWFSNQYMDFSNLRIGSEDYTVLLHEIGHSLGLKHSFEKSAYGVVPIDSLSYTVMSYSSYENGSSWEGGTAFDFPQTLMMYDIAALQFMYGANWNANADDTTYTWSANNNTLSIKELEDGSLTLRSFDPEGDKIYQTLWDGNGVDTYNFADYTTNLLVDLRPGHWVQTDVVNNFQTADIDDAFGDRLAPGNIANALMVNQDARSLIENAIGGDGRDKFIANQAANIFTGDGSADSLRDQDIFQWLQMTDLLNTSLLNDWDSIRDFEVGFDHIDVSAIEIIDETHSTYSNGYLKLADSDNHIVAEIQVTVIGGGGFSQDWFV